MSTTDDLRAIRMSIADTAPVHERGVIWGVLDALRDTLDVLIAANDTGVSHRDADDGAGKGSTAAGNGARSDAQPAEAPGEGRSEIGPQKGVQSLADEMREFAAAVAGGTWTAFAASSAIEGFADRADALEAERDEAREHARVAAEMVKRTRTLATAMGVEHEPDSVSIDILPDPSPFQIAMLTTERDRLAAWKREATVVLTAYDDLAKRAVPEPTLGRSWVDMLAEHVDALTTERDRLAADIAIMRDADLTATDVQRRRAEKAEAAVARVRALLDRPLIPSALLRDALDGVDAGGEA